MEEAKRHGNLASARLWRWRGGRAALTASTGLERDVQLGISDCIYGD